MRKSQKLAIADVPAAANAKLKSPRVTLENKDSSSSMCNRYKGRKETVMLKPTI